MIPDLVRTIAQFLPDIRVLRVCHELEMTITAEPEYALWQKCAAADSIYSHATVKMLGERKLDLTGIVHAVEHDNIPMIKHLVESGASIKELLVAATKYDHLHILEIYFETNYGWDILAAAVEFDHQRIAECIFNVDQDVADRDHGYLIHIACKNGNAEMLRLLLEHGLDFDYSAVSRAVEQDNCKIVQILLDAGAQPNTALDKAIKNQSNKVVELLIGLGANISDLDVIVAACTHEIHKILELVDPAVGLRCAILAGNQHSVEYFMSRGAIAPANAVGLATIGLDICEENLRASIAEYIVQCTDETAPALGYLLRRSMANEDARLTAILAEGGVCTLWYKMVDSQN